MKFGTEGGTMVDLVAVKQNFTKISGNASNDKNALFAFVLEIVCLTNKFLSNFAHEHIIDHKIIPNDIEIHVR